MYYCPNCHHVVEKNEEFCPNCGFFIEPGKAIFVDKEGEELWGEKAKAATPQEPKRPFYKRPVFWVLITIFLFLLFAAGGITGGYYYFNNKITSDYKTEVKTIWTDVVSKAKTLGDTIEAVSGESDLSMLSNELSDMENLLAKKQSQAVNLEPPSKYVKQNKDLLVALDKMANYVIQAKILTNKEPAFIEYYKLSQLTAEAEAAKLASENFVSETDFIGQSLPPTIFDIKDIFQPIVKEAKLNDKKKKKEQQEEKEATEKKMAQQTVISFMQARIAKNVTEMRRYMTEKAAKAFEPDLEFQGDFDPIDFKILKTELTIDRGYIITGDETDRSWEGSNFVTSWQFQVILEGGSWLIDHRKVLPTEKQQNTSN